MLGAEYGGSPGRLTAAARLCAGLVSPKLVLALFELNVFVNIAARLPQILQNYKVRRARLPALCRGSLMARCWGCD